VHSRFGVFCHGYELESRASQTLPHDRSPPAGLIWPWATIRPAGKMRIALGKILLQEP